MKGKLNSSRNSAAIRAAEADFAAHADDPIDDDTRANLRAIVAAFDEAEHLAAEALESAIDRLDADEPSADDARRAVADVDRGMACADVIRDDDVRAEFVAELSRVRVAARRHLAMAQKPPVTRSFRKSGTFPRLYRMAPRRRLTLRRGHISRAPRARRASAIRIVAGAGDGPPSPPEPPGNRPSLGGAS